MSNKVNKGKKADTRELTADEKELIAYTSKIEAMNKKIEERVIFHKQKHPDIWTLIVEDKFCLLSKPNRDTYEEVLGLVTPMPNIAPKFVTAGLRIMQACWIEGDKEMLSDDDYLCAAGPKAASMIKVKAASIKKN